MAAAQRVAHDLSVLVKAVELPYAWCDSMEMAVRAQSGTAPAIQATMAGARIGLSHRSVKLALDSLQLGLEIGRPFDPTAASTLASASMSMATALEEHAVEMHKKAEIVAGWTAYKAALAAPQNRKAARRALRLNSTLANCWIAHGACRMGDPAAKHAIQRAGLTPAMLADHGDVCARLVAFLEASRADDPVVLVAERAPRP